MDEQQTQHETLLESDDLKKIVENLLFITDRPLKPARIAEVVDELDTKKALELILELVKEYNETGRAIQIVEVGGGYQMSTKPEYGRWVRKLYNEKMTTKLSNAALETLAIIAYKQPATRAEIEAIRGVDVAAPLERLLERGLVRVLGKKDTIGRPMVYGTTEEFLRTFGLNKISELPDLQVFAAKQVHEKQEDLPFDEALPPVAGPAIIPIEEWDEAERLKALQSGVDVSYSRHDALFEDGTEIIQETLTVEEENGLEAAGGISGETLDETEDLAENTEEKGPDAADENLAAEEH